MLRLWYLTNLLLSQYVTDSRFIVGSLTEIETHAWLYKKMLGHFGIPHIGAPLTPSYQLNSAKQVLPDEKAPWEQIKCSMPWGVSRLLRVH